jgi:hypothetical protein
MSLPNQLDVATPAGSDSPSEGDDQFRNLKQFLVDVFGFTSGTNVTAQGISYNTNGVIDFLTRATWQEGGAISSASTITIDTDGNVFHITGTTGITAINSITGTGPVILVFDAALTITHNGTSLILQGAANFTTAAGNILILFHEGSGNWREVARSTGIPAILGANTYTGIQRWDKGADLSSASSITIGTDGNYFDVTGTTGITAFSAVAAGTVIILQFDGAATITHHASSMKLIGGANYTTSAGDTLTFISLGSGNWQEIARNAAAAITATANGANNYIATYSAATTLNGEALLTFDGTALSHGPHGTSGGNTGEDRFLELAAAGTNYVGFKAPDAIAANIVWTLPNADGSDGQVMKTDGSKALTWTTISSGAESGTWAVYSINAGTIYQVGSKWRRINVRIAGASTGENQYSVTAGASSPPGTTLLNPFIDVAANSAAHQVPCFFIVPGDWYFKVTVTTGALDSATYMDE